MNEFCKAGVQALANSSFIANLHHLDLTFNEISEAEAQALKKLNTKLVIKYSDERDTDE